MLTDFSQWQRDHCTSLKPRHKSKPFTIRLSVRSTASQSHSYDQLVEAVLYSPLLSFAALQDVILPLQMGWAILYMDYGICTSEILE